MNPILVCLVGAETTEATGESAGCFKTVWTKDEEKGEGGEGAFKGDFHFLFVVL